MEGLPLGSCCSPGLLRGRGPESRDARLSGVAGRTKAISESWSAPGQLSAWAGMLDALRSIGLFGAPATEKLRGYERDWVREWDSFLPCCNFSTLASPSGLA